MKIAIKSWMTVKFLARVREGLNEMFDRPPGHQSPNPGGSYLPFFSQWKGANSDVESRHAGLRIAKTKKMNDSVSIWLCIENVVLLHIET